MWNPFSFCGTPFAADLSQAAFEPVNLLFLGFDPHRSVAIGIVPHHIGASIGAYCLDRRLGASPVAAETGSLAFGYSGCAVSVDDNPLYFAGVVWTPWILWAVDRTCERRPIGRVATLSAFIACMCFSGDVQWTYVTAILALAFRLHRSAPGDRLPSLGIVALGGGLAVGLCAFQLIPFVEVAMGSSRRGGLADAEALSWALHPLRLFGIAVPTPFGRVADQSLWGDLFTAGRHTGPWSQSAYSGAITLVVAASGLRHRRAHFFLGLAVVGLLLALGPLTPVAPVAREIQSLWASFRYPEKTVALVSLGLAMAAALSADRAFRIRPGRGPVLVAVSLCCIWLGSGSLLARSPWPSRSAWRGTGRIRKRLRRPLRT